MDCTYSKRNRFTAGLLVFAMLLVLFVMPLPATARAATEGDFKYAVFDGKVTIEAYLGEGGAVTIPQTLGGYPVESIGYRAFASCVEMSSVTIPEGVKFIDSYAFYDCTGLPNVTLPDSVQTVGDCAFGHCTDMDWINFGSSVTSIGICAFGFCTELQWVIIPDSVTSIGDYAFQDCRGLTEVIIGDGVKTIPTGMFYNCNGLSTVTLGDNVVTIEDKAFYACDLRIATAPATVKAIGDSAFYGCINFQDVYYAGSKAQGDSIEFGPNNDDLLGTNVHFGHVHDFSKTAPKVTPSTCLQGGYIVYTCTHGEEYGMAQLPVDHYIVRLSEVPATCTQPGMTAGQECAWCSLVIQERQPIEPKGHTMQGDICIICSADYTGDGILTDGDAIYLLRHTLFPEKYPMSGLGDVNCDGILTDADAIYLLRYTLFPESYPLYPETGNTGNELKTIQQGKLIMAINAPFPPYEMYHNGELAGIEIEIAHEIAKKLGLKLEIRDMVFDEALMAVPNGACDIVMTGIVSTEEREELMDFTNSYTSNVQVVIVKEGSDVDIYNLDGKMIGVKRGTTGHFYASNPPELGGYGEDHVIVYESGSEAIQALRSGLVDCVIIDEAPAEEYVKEYDGLSILSRPWVVENYAIGCTEGNTALVKAINQALAELTADGTIQKIINKYIVAD